MPDNVPVCPHCAIPLAVGTRGAVTLHGCGNCGGLWVGPQLASRLATVLDPDAMALADLASQNARPFPELAKQPLCPDCRAPLRRAKVDGPNVDIDYCDAHGTWFDREELQTVERFIDQRRRSQQEAESRPKHPHEVWAQPAPAEAPPDFRRDDGMKDRASSWTDGALDAGFSILGVIFESVVDGILS